MADQEEQPKKQRPQDKVCGANTKHGPCQQWKGANTSHKGVGACSRHGGSTPNAQTAADRDMVTTRMATYGEPLEIDPKTALLNEVKRTAGHVAWLGQVVAGIQGETDEAKITQWTKAFGRKPSAVIELYQEERRMLRAVCTEALRNGVEEKLVDLAQREMQLFAQIINSIFSDPDLKLSREQEAAIPDVVRRHLSAVA